ncbi:protein of unknown function [Cyanobium sp. NIES-981]|nr:protein of unknown function [Cyanobium sp. NIES-981]
MRKWPWRSLWLRLPEGSCRTLAAAGKGRQKILFRILPLLFPENLVQLRSWAQQRHDSVSAPVHRLGLGFSHPSCGGS